MNAAITRFRDLDKWSIPKVLQLTSILPNGWSLEALGNLVNQVAEKTRVEKEREYRLIGVKWYSEGVFHRETVKGSETSAVYLTPIIPGAFIYNRLFAWKQSFAVVPPEYDGYYVSSEFPQFIVDQSRLLPEYLYLIFRLQKTISLVLSASVGSAAVSRNRFKEEEFLKFEIPLPSLDMQRAIVARWQEAQEAAQEADEQAAQILSELEGDVLAILGLNVPKLANKPKFFAGHFHDFERWSVSANQAQLAGIDIENAKYPSVELGDILLLVQYGTSEKANEKMDGTPVLRINNIKGGMIDVSNLKHVPLDKKTKQGLLLQDGDVLIIRTSGSKGLVGTCSVFHEESEYVFASYLIRLRVNSVKANPDYVSWFINSLVGRSQIDVLSRQIMQNNINSEELRSLEIVIPPLEVQQTILEKLQASRSKAAHQRELAAQIHQKAEAEVEAMILGTKKV